MSRLSSAAGGTLRILAGPWPLYPRAMALVALYGLFVSAGSRTQVQSESVGEFVRLVWPQWVGVALASCGVGLAVFAASRIPPIISERCRPESFRSAYLGAIALASLIGSVAIVAIVELSAGPEVRLTLPPLHVRFILNLPVVLVVLLVANGVIAAVQARLARQETILADRLFEVRSERSLLLQAEEQVRAEASRTLHDDIQATLLRAVVRLEGLRDRLDDDDRRPFDTSIEEIETVREVRVRSLGRILSPNIADIGLLQALEELGTLYADVMPVRFAFPVGIEERFRPVGEPDDTALALYRIAEQCLLNALKHGRPSAASLALEELPDGRVRMIIEADGAAPAEDPIAGTGTATINSWLDAVGGTWTIAPVAGGGSRAIVVVGRA